MSNKKKYNNLIYIFMQSPGLTRPYMSRLLRWVNRTGPQSRGGAIPLRFLHELGLLDVKYEENKIRFTYLYKR
jgi:hypothetical protein